MKMGHLEDILEKATEEQKLNAIKFFSPFRVLAEQGYELFLGSKIGQDRNQFFL